MAFFTPITTMLSYTDSSITCPSIKGLCLLLLFI